MLGALISAVFAVACGCAAQGLLHRWMKSLDPAERWGVGGLLGLGAAGTLSVFVGLAPSGLVWGLPVLAGAAAVGAAWAWRSKKLPSPGVQIPKGWAILSPVYAVLIGLLGLVGALAPSTTMDWDSLAYHLAAPKIWLLAGQVGPIQAMHHSNFPFAIDGLYLYGLWWGGEAGAKAFSTIIFGAGALALFGHLRRTVGLSAAWWAVPAYASIPVVAWESGTAYVDVGHGLFAAFALLYGSEAMTDKRAGSWMLAGLSLGFCLGSKHTGLHVGLAFGAAALIVMALRRDFSHLNGLGLAAALGLSLAAPWYAKSFAFTGNPVFPFLHSVFPSPEWDEWRAEIYANEQQTFGVGRTESGRDLTQIGHAVLGLAYQPGRYVNPGQTQGLGFPTGAVGAAAVLLALIPAAMGWVNRRSQLLLGAMGIGMALWFVLSQQSRYLTIWAIPACAVGAIALGMLGKPSLRRPLQALIGLQAVYTLFLLHTTTTSSQIAVVTGGMPASEYRRQTTSFAIAAEEINSRQEITRIALYDEVFGFLLNKPYLWANPGHSKVIPYENLETGEEYAAAMRELGFSHAYVSTAFTPPADLERWMAAMGLQGDQPYTGEERAGQMENLDLKWRLLIAEAVRGGHAVLEPAPGRGLILRFTPGAG